MDRDIITQEVEKLRAFFQKDGGDIELVQINDDNEVYLKLKGQCRSCPVNKGITGEGVEAILKEKVPEVKIVYLDKR
ncbi:MAG: NifU family protein [Bacteroidales bacterium]|nr:NifU family protein [Bacteroidales bacterium]MCF8336572.1 NifU family protein [Bacteroidales bacterium]